MKMIIGCMITLICLRMNSNCLLLWKKSGSTIIAQNSSAIILKLLIFCHHILLSENMPRILPTVGHLILRSCYRPVRMDDQSKNRELVRLIHTSFWKEHGNFVNEQGQFESKHILYTGSWRWKYCCSCVAQTLLPVLYWSPWQNLLDWSNWAQLEDLQKE